jgi:hypothetical protein
MMIILTLLSQIICQKWAFEWLLGPMQAIKLAGEEVSSLMSDLM